MGSTATFTIAITPTNPIPVNGQLIIALPETWPNDPQNSNLISSTPTCAAVSTLSSSLTCGYAVVSG